MVRAISRRWDYSATRKPAAPQHWSALPIRKGKAAGDAVDVYQYYTDPTGDGAAVPVPRDALGQVWDRLEANPVTSFLFHWLTRQLAFHVEAFFTAEGNAEILVLSDDGEREIRGKACKKLDHKRHKRFRGLWLRLPEMPS